MLPSGENRFTMNTNHTQTSSNAQSSAIPLFWLIYQWVHYLSHLSHRTWRQHEVRLWNDFNVRTFVSIQTCENVSECTKYTKQNTTTLSDVFRFHDGLQEVTFYIIFKYYNDFMLWNPTQIKDFYFILFVCCCLQIWTPQCIKQTKTGNIDQQKYKKEKWIKWL